MIECTLALEDLNTFTKKLFSLINKKDIIVLLRGDLASGKTTLVKDYVKHQGIQEEVTSPTFLIQTSYNDEIYHYDLYNKTLGEFVSLGLLEEFEKQGVHFVEWGEKNLEDVLNSYGFELLVVEITKLDNKRRYKIYA